MTKKCSDCRHAPTCQQKKTLDDLNLKGASIKVSDVCKRFDSKNFKAA